MSKHTVIRWTQSPNQNFTGDNRGWPKGKRRKWSATAEARIRVIHRYLLEDPEEFSMERQQSFINGASNTPMRHHRFERLAKF